MLGKITTFAATAASGPMIVMGVPEFLTWVAANADIAAAIGLTGVGLLVIGELAKSKGATTIRVNSATLEWEFGSE